MLIDKSYKIRNLTPEKNKEIQEICFKNDIYWRVSSSIIIEGVKNTDCAYLYINVNTNTLSFGTESTTFIVHENTEISADAFIYKFGGTPAKTKNYTIENFPEINSVLLILNDGTRIFQSPTTTIELSKEGIIWTI